MLPAAMSLSRDNPKRRAIIMLMAGGAVVVLFLVYSLLGGRSGSTKPPAPGVPFSQLLGVSADGGQNVGPGGLVIVEAQPATKVELSDRNPFAG